MSFITTTPSRGGLRLRARGTLLALLGLFGISGLASAADTFFIRSDGGDAAQCTGKADAAYPGSGSGQACAWKHPFIAFPPAGTPRIAGGDTVKIASGSYMMGLGAPGAAICNQAWSWDCYMSAVPSGPSATQPTRIIGTGEAPELWGTERASLVLNLKGSSNVVVENLEITDHESCIDQHCHGGVCEGEVLRCNRSQAPWGKWAGTGISARDSANVTLRDVNVHGMANRGVLAGRLTDWTTERLTIRANGWAGWDGDLNEESGNSGQIIFRELELAWNGCAERYPGGEIAGCWAQTAGGYGDGLGTGATGGHWVIEDSLIHHNTSDGLDLLYMRDGGSVTIRRTWAEGNAGNQLKTKGEVLIENSVAVGNCSYFTGHGNMFDGDHCRALGNVVSVGLHNGNHAELINNTITGEGDCLVLSGGGDASASLTFTNNVLLGKTDWRQDWENACGHYADGSSARVTWSGNNVFAVKNNHCPAGSQCTDPQLVDANMASFDPTPADGSPLVDTAIAVGPDHDYFGHARPAGGAPDIGAVERGAAAAGGEPTDPTDPTDPTEPTDPTDPTDPIVPTDPVEPTDPNEPTDPTVPTDPVAPQEPTPAPGGEQGAAVFANGFDD
jgi:hypothetical protein